MRRPEKRGTAGPGDGGEVGSDSVEASRERSRDETTRWRGRRRPEAADLEGGDGGTWRGAGASNGESGGGTPRRGESQREAAPRGIRWR